MSVGSPLMREAVAHSVRRPRGYSGDAGLIDIIYNKDALGEISPLGRDVFDVTIRFQSSDAARQQRDYAEVAGSSAWQAGKRILVLACGHVRKGDPLIGQDLGNITLVDQDPLSPDFGRSNHSDRVRPHEAHVFRHLRAAVGRGETFDLIYRDGCELEFYAREVASRARSWHDPTNSVVWCEMEHDG